VYVGGIEEPEPELNIRDPEFDPDLFIGTAFQFVLIPFVSLASIWPILIKYDGTDALLPRVFEHHNTTLLAKSYKISFASPLYRSL
jgi:hypothetical protein